jgi:hypothetical protein
LRNTLKPALYAFLLFECRAALLIQKGSLAAADPAIGVHAASAEGIRETSERAAAAAKDWAENLISD